MDTRTRILEVAQELVQTMGANAMSYQHISDAIGIRKPSIHHHFPSKEQLIEALIERYTEYFFGLVDGIAGSKKTGAGKLRDYIGLYEATLKQGAHDQACPMVMLGAEVRTLGEIAAERVRQFYAQNERRLAFILAGGKRDGSLVFKGSPETLAGLVFASLEGAMLVARGSGRPEHFREMTGQLLRMVEK
jgi:TetR/AcrR family transcriptional repressor of nem operon